MSKSREFPVRQREHSGANHAVTEPPDVSQRDDDAEHALRERTRHDRLLVDIALDAIVDMNEGGTITNWNTQAVSLFGWSREEAVGRQLHETIVPPSLRAAHREGLRRFLTTGKTSILNRRIEITAMHRDGHEFPVELAVAALRENDEYTFRAFLRDLSERRKADQDRRLMESRIQQAQKMEQLGVLASGVAHDFNNLLAAMLGHAGLARQELPPDSSAIPMLDEIVNAAQRAAEMTQQLLAYAGRGHVHVESLDLAHVVDELSHLLRPVMSNKANLHLDLAPAPIAADASQIRQVVMNLLTNASEALEGNPGDITIRTGVRRSTRADLLSPYLTEDLPEGDYSFVSVQDGGVGMEADTLRRVFDPFFTTKFTGRGLGMAAVLGIVRSHRGSIQVTSELGAGSTFLMLLPTTRTAPVRGRSARRTPAMSEIVGRGVVLVIDDEESVRTVLSRVLTRAGYKVLSAADGQEALIIFAREVERISAVVLDLTMPRLDGIEVMRLLRRLSPGVRALLMSGYSDDEVKTRFADEHVAGFLQKPFQNKELLTRLAALLRG